MIRLVTTLASASAVCIGVMCMAAISVQHDPPSEQTEAHAQPHPVNGDALHDEPAGESAGSKAMSAGTGYAMARFVIAGGGETFSTGSSFSLGGTIGQHDAGTMSGGEPGNEYTIAGGFWAAGAADVEPDCPTGDLNCDDVVDSEDLFILLAAWGECADCANCPADLNDDCGVDAEDLFILLANWG